jgi:hypothetical protein
MQPEEAHELITTKLSRMVEEAGIARIDIDINPSIVDRVVVLSGGHPHLLQLLGSHLIEHENEDPDGVINARDLVTSLRNICYEDRARVYDATLHTLEIQGQADALRDLIEIASSGFPTWIGRSKAVDLVGKDSVEWLVNNNILHLLDRNTYGLVDEFLRIRLVLDKEKEEEETERRIISGEGGLNEKEY